MPCSFWECWKIIATSFGSLHFFWLKMVPVTFIFSFCIIIFFYLATYLLMEGRVKWSQADYGFEVKECSLKFKYLCKYFQRMVLEDNSGRSTKVRSSRGTKLLCNHLACKWFRSAVWNELKQTLKLSSAEIKWKCWVAEMWVKSLLFLCWNQEISFWKAWTESGIWNSLCHGKSGNTWLNST